MALSKFGAIISNVASFISESMPWNRRHDPEWLKAIQGDSPLLSRSEWEYIAEVRHSIIKEARSRPDIPIDHHLEKKLSVIKNNFEEVINYLKRSSVHRRYFMTTYPSWLSVRKMSIIQLKDIAKSMRIDKKEFAASRGAGNSVSLVGGLMCLVPGIGALRLAGGVLMGLGSIAAAVVQYAEFQQLKDKIKEAEKIMLKDSWYSEKLWKWMNDASHVQQAYETIRNMNVGSDLMEIARDLYHCYEKKCTTEQLQINVLKILSAVKFSSGVISEIADVITILIAIFMLYDRHRPLFNLVFETYKCKQKLTTACNVFATAAKMTSAVNAGKSTNLTTFQKTRIGIGIALDIISIIQAANDFDSVSAESVEIFKVAKKLEEEMEIFKKVYNGVNRT